MQFPLALRCPLAVPEPTVEALQQIFDWYMTLAIPYETLSNIETGVLVKDEEQMLGSVLARDGGHCVEHSVLLGAVLRDFGFDAVLINADYYDYLTNTIVRVSKPLLAVELGRDTWVCDPYYRGILYPLPQRGVVRWRNFEISRDDAATFRLIRMRAGRPIDEDRANFAWTITTRRAQFEERYESFSPFGVTAPFFQLLRRARTALFYSPREDCLIVVEGSVCRATDESGLSALEWLPSGMVERIRAALPARRRERMAAVEFLNSGLFSPYYERLERRGLEQ